MFVLTIFEPNTTIALILFIVGIAIGRYNLSVSKFWLFNLAASITSAFFAAAAFFFPPLREDHSFLIWVPLGLSAAFAVSAVLAKVLGVEDVEMGKK